MKERRRGTEDSDVSVRRGVSRRSAREAMAWEADVEDGRSRSEGRVRLETV